MRATLENWNRRLHFYLGLYFLLFLWLFAITGLFLNHPNWEFHQFWAQRQESSVEHPIRAPKAADYAGKAIEVAAQLGLSGEPEWPRPITQPEQLVFRFVKPGEITDVEADFAAGVARVKQIRLNTWGVANMLHSFTGVRINDPSVSRDWIMTMVWSLAMDALAIGLVVMVLSSYYMWFRLKPKRRLGVVVLAAGWIVCAFFALGLQWM